MATSRGLDDLETWLGDGYERSFRTACLILSNGSDAEEVVHEAFLRAWRFRASLATGTDSKPWLYRVLVNTCHSKLRKELPHGDRRLADPETDTGPGTADEFEQFPLENDLLRALKSLPAHLRAVAVLRYFAGLSERELAAAIGRRSGTVKSRLHEARRLLAAHPALQSERSNQFDLGSQTMTMLDEETLRSLLRDAAESFDLPAEGPENILSAASVSERPRPARAFRFPRTTPGRIALVGAVMIVLIAGISLAGAGVIGNSHPRTVAGPTSVAPSIRPSGTAERGSGSANGGSAAQGSAGIAVPAPTGGSSSTSTPPSLPPGVVGQSAKVETTGSVDLAIGSGSLNQVVGKLTQLTTGDGGFVAKSQLQLGSTASGTESYGSLVLQVPQASFSSLLSGTETVGKVTSVSSTSTDVTGQYVDLQARISALDASRQQYLTIMSEATSIGDILSVQSQLDVIQSQTEQLQGQLNLLDSQTTYATLSVSLSQLGHPAPPPPRPVSGLTSAWRASINGFTSGFEWLLRIAGPTLFVLILIAALALVARWAWRSWRRRLL